MKKKKIKPECLDDFPCPVTDMIKVGKLVVRLPAINAVETSDIYLGSTELVYDISAKNQEGDELYHIRRFERMDADKMVVLGRKTLHDAIGIRGRFSYMKTSRDENGCPIFWFKTDYGRKFSLTRSVAGHFRSVYTENSFQSQTPKKGQYLVSSFWVSAEKEVA